MTDNVTITIIENMVNRIEDLVAVKYSLENRVNALLDKQADMERKLMVADQGKTSLENIEVILKAARQNKPIEMIKAVRHATGCGLKEGKYLVDKHQDLSVKVAK